MSESFSNFQNYIEQYLIVFQQNVGAYDLSPWEIAENDKLRRVKKNSKHANKESPNIPSNSRPRPSHSGQMSELLDIDLIQGAVFNKPKQRQATLPYSLLYYLLLPCYHNFWLNQVSPKFYRVMQFFYCLQLINLYFYFYKNEHFSSLRSYSSELILPLVAGWNLSIIFCRVVVTKLKLGAWDLKNSDLKSDDSNEVGVDLDDDDGDYSDDGENVDDPSESTEAVFDENSENLENPENPEKTDNPGKILENKSSFQSLDDPLNFVHKTVPSYTAKNDTICCRTWTKQKPKLSDGTDSNYSNLPIYIEFKENVTAFDIASKMSKNISEKYSNFFPTAQYSIFIIIYSVFLAFLPVLFRIQLKTKPFGDNLYTLLFTLNGILFRFLLALVYFSMLCIALRAYYHRLLFAKMFSRLTSARRAQKHDLPHFRLFKTKNIKVWLTLRSYLKRRGPQRSIDVIVSSCFYGGMLLLVPICINLLQESKTAKKNSEGISEDTTIRNTLFLWEISLWSVGISIFLIKFIIIGSEINKKYLSKSSLLTEQLNVYFRMDNRDAKSDSESKEKLQHANQCLQLCQKLLTEIESPYKLSGVAMSPLMAQILRIVVLSAFSGVFSQFLGFNLKLWKIKA